MDYGILNEVRAACDASRGAKSGLMIAGDGDGDERATVNIQHYAEGAQSRHEKHL
jgi:hypothetical protein